MKTVFPSELPTFGDRVRIRTSPETESKGVAGLIGQVYGQTTPSVTGVEAIGELTEDYAVNVFFKDRNESFWFAPMLVEFVDHAPGTEIRLDGIAKKWTRTEAGDWREEKIKPQPHRSWWRFWKNH